MAADEDDTFFEGKMKNVLEGGIVGSAAELLFKIIRMIEELVKRLIKMVKIKLKIMQRKKQKK